MSVDPRSDLIADIRSKPKKPLKHARSKAELTRVRQGWFMISIQTTNVILTILIALKTFGLI